MHHLVCLLCLLLPCFFSLPTLKAAAPSTHPITAVQTLSAKASSLAAANTAMINKQLLPFRQKVIVIDAGHGGDDLGTQSISKPRYLEKHLNLSTAKMLERFLKQFGYKIVMTRHNDIFLNLEKRAEIANRLQSDLFVSVHYNSAPARHAEGIEVFFYRDDKNKERVVSSKILAQLVLSKIIENTNAKSRGVKHGNLSVIRNTQMPAILVEGGFLTNEDEMQRLKDPDYLKRIAWGIAQGIHAYFGKS